MTKCMICGKETMYGYALCDSQDCYIKRLDQEEKELEELEQE